MDVSWVDLASGSAMLALLGWALVLFQIWRTVVSMRRLPGFAPPAETGTYPTYSVSAVVAGGLDARALDRTVRSLLAQEGIRLQIVVVTRGEDDPCDEAMHELAAQDSRILVLRNPKLPVGWIEKNYALELGQGRAEGDFILFTEPGVFHGRRAIYNAMRCMDEEQLDHLAVHPRLEAGSFWEALILPLYVLIWEFRFVPHAAARPDSGVGAGVSAFNLVRAETYRLRGTHARIRNAILEDRDLARMMREDGGRGSVMRAVTQLRTRPYRSFDELYAGIRCGTLVSAQDSAWTAFVMGAILVMGGMLPPFLVLAGLVLAWSGGGPLCLVLALTTVSLPVLGLLRARTMVRFEPIAALFFPLGAFLIGLSTMQAALGFALQGRLEWQGRSYQRDELQAPRED